MTHHGSTAPTEPRGPGSWEHLEVAPLLLAAVLIAAVIAVVVIVLATSAAMPVPPPVPSPTPAGY